MLKIKIGLFIGLFTCVASSITFAQQGDETTDMARQLPDEMIVTEDRSAYQIRRQILDAEENMYELFNELNDEKRFHISCSTENRNNSHISRRSCAPEFHRQATRAHGQAYLQEFRSQFMNPGELSAGNAPSSVLPTRVMINVQQNELKTKMEELAKSNPEFLSALIKYVEMKEQYTQRFQNNDG